MKSAKFTAICVLSSALLLSSTLPSAKVSAKYSHHTVRVGMYYSMPGKDTQPFSSSNTSQSGFEIGYSTSRSFVKLFDLNNNKIIIAPSGNLSANSTDSNTVYSDTSGQITFGGYHLQLRESFNNYSDANSVVENNQNAFVAYSDNVFVVRVGSYYSYDEANAAKEQYSDCTVISPSSNGLVLCDLKGKKILFEYENNKKSFALQARNNGTVTLPTHSKNYYSYKGFFEYTANNKKLSMVNGIELEQYVKSVMANEIGTNASKKVTKAFSILVRTVPLTCKHSEYGFDVCNQSCCQVYKGTYKESLVNDAIVDSTKGKILTYNGSPIYCLYNYSNGGTSCSSAAAWGNRSLPYLTSVYLEEPEEAAVTWQKVFTKQDLFNYLKVKGAYSSLHGEIADVKVINTDPQGSEYVTVFAVTDTTGNTVTVYNSTEIRGTLEFSSSNFVVNYSLNATIAEQSKCKNENITSIITADGIKKIDSIGETYDILTSDGITDNISADLIIFNGKGKGHGVGFSQVGAEVLISEGYDYAYTLTFYFPGTVLTNIND